MRPCVNASPHFLETWEGFVSSQGPATPGCSRGLVDGWHLFILTCVGPRMVLESNNSRVIDPGPTVDRDSLCVIVFTARTRTMFAIVHAHAVTSSAATPLALSPGPALVPDRRFR